MPVLDCICSTLLSKDRPVLIGAGEAKGVENPFMLDIETRLRALISNPLKPLLNPWKMQRGSEAKTRDEITVHLRDSNAFEASIYTPGRKKRKDKRYQERL